MTESLAPARCAGESVSLWCPSGLVPDPHAPHSDGAAAANAVYADIGEAMQGSLCDIDQHMWPRFIWSCGTNVYLCRGRCETGCAYGHARLCVGRLATHRPYQQCRA